MATLAGTWRGQPQASSAAVTHAPDVARARLLSIDALRGLVMVIMLLDHVRENWFLHMQVTDPVDATSVDPALFFTRLTSTLCAPVFVALTGLSAYLYGQSHSLRETSSFLVKRGLFLIVIDVTLITLVWSSSLPPKLIWLQVIWVIGLCMILLAGLIHLPRALQLALGLAIVFGHNLLDGIVLSPADTWYVPWAILHQRALIELPFGVVAKTSYPLLAWVGVILLGYALGPWFSRGFDALVRQRRLLLLGAGMIAGFLVLRMLNVYGDKPWFDAGSALRTTMSFLALTKYPPSLLFLLSTLGVGAILLALFDRRQDGPLLRPLAHIGGAPMFFYILHLVVLRTLYHIALLIWGPTHGDFYGVDSLGWVWVWYAALIVPLYYPTRWFADLKKRRKDIGWLKYL